MNRFTLTAAYLLAIVAANLSVAHFGPVSTPINAFLFIALDLSTRDRLHDLWGRNVARNMALLIAAGGILSFALNHGAGRIALASMLSFALSETLAAIVYALNRRKPYITRCNASNVAGAAVDSIAFPVLAFGGFPIWIILGQFVAKALGGYIWSLILAPSRPEKETK